VTTGCTTFTTTHRVIYRVHRYRASARANTSPAAATSLTNAFVHVFCVGNSTYCSDRQFIQYITQSRPKASLSVAYTVFASQPIAQMHPALRAMEAPVPGLISTLWMIVPIGILESGNALPTSGAMSSPDNTGLSYFDSLQEPECMTLKPSA
jgi:hypothetical protein